MPFTKDFVVKNGMVVAGGALTVNATTSTVSTSANASVGGALSVAGNTTLSGPSTLAGNTTVTGQLFTYNAATIPVDPLGTIASSGTADLDYNVGSMFTLTQSGAITFNFKNLPTGYWELGLTTTNSGTGSITITLNGSASTVTWVKGDGTSSTSFSTLGVTLQASGVNHFTFWGIGNTIYGKAA